MAKKKETPHYSVYVIRLDPKAADVPKVARANPKHEKGKPCVYVGMTWHTPRYRLGQHLLGKKECYPCKLVTEFGIGLMPKLFEKYNEPLMTEDEAASREKKLAKRLRDRGYAVWQK
jgi:hypothetical protein